MKPELKNVIIKSVQDNATEYQLVNFITAQFSSYIFTANGKEYLIGGEAVANFIKDFIKLYNTQLI